MPKSPTLLFIIGPPAVGKMTVGHEIAARTGLRLFHNHLTIEPVLRFFDFGTAQFERLVSEFRQRLIEEVAASELPGLIFTYVCAFDVPGDLAELESYAAPFRQRGARVLYLELTAGQDERLLRTLGEFRLAEKPSQRDIDATQQRLIDWDLRYRLTSDGEFDGVAEYLHVDNTHLSAEEVAQRTIERFALSRDAGT